MNLKLYIMMFCFQYDFNWITNPAWWQVILGIPTLTGLIWQIRLSVTESRLKRMPVFEIIDDTKNNEQGVVPLENPAYNVSVNFKNTDFGIDFRKFYVFLKEGEKQYFEYRVFRTMATRQVDEPNKRINLGSIKFEAFDGQKYSQVFYFYNGKFYLDRPKSKGFWPKVNITLNR